MRAHVDCPYVGLRPFKAQDGDFFFGRERDIRIIASNVRTSRLTVLYGASGVGKSSVLQAGVLPYLSRDDAVSAVYWNAWQSPHFLRDLASEFQRVSGYEQQDLGSLLENSKRTVVLFLDQFEEFLLYQADRDEGEEFQALLARIANDDDILTYVLIGIRQEALSLLDKKLSIRIPDLLSNTLFLEHLRAPDARRAIEGPLEVLRTKGAGSFSIEPELVNRLLSDLRANQNAAGANAAATTEVATVDGHIETAYLQLVMRRLWDAEMRNGSQQLRASTLDTIGGAARILQRHVEDVMQLLDNSQQRVAAKLFRHLVTPSRTKIAQLVSDLVAFGEAPQLDVRAVLGVLSEGEEIRILRHLMVPEKYELFHDVLAQSVLDWVARFEEQARQRAIQLERARELEDARRVADSERERANERARYASNVARSAVAMAGMLLLAIGVSIYAWISRENANAARAQLSAQNQLLKDQEREIEERIRDADRAKAEALEQRNLITTQKDQLYAQLRDLEAANARREGAEATARQYETEARNLRTQSEQYAARSTCAGATPLPFEVDVDLIRAIAPESRTPEAWTRPLLIAMHRCEINTESRAAMFLAQVASESGQFNRVEERFDYSSAQLLALWPSRFSSESAATLESQPEQLANYLNANRLGNGDVASGDGWRYRARGLFLVSGRRNYEQFGENLRRPYLDEPDLLARPDDAALSAAYFWATRRLNAVADGNDIQSFDETTRAIGGSTAIGVTQRRSYWESAKGAIRPLGTRVQPPPVQATRSEALIADAERFDAAPNVREAELLNFRLQVDDVFGVNVPESAWSVAVHEKKIADLVRRADNPTLPPTFRAVVERVLRSHPNSNLFVSGSTKEQKTSNALDEWQSAMNEAESGQARIGAERRPTTNEIIGVLDATVFGKTGIHILFADEGIYFRNAALRREGPRRGFIPYIRFPRSTFSACAYVTACLGSDDVQFDLSGSDMKPAELVAIMEELKAALLLGSSS